MKHSDHAALIAALVPTNKALAFVAISTPSLLLNEALDISEARARELDEQMSDCIKPFIKANNGGIHSNDLLTLGSYIAKTPQELAWLTYQTAKMGDGLDRPEDQPGRSSADSSGMPKDLRGLLDHLKVRTAGLPSDIGDREVSAVAKAKLHKKVTKGLKVILNGLKDHLDTISK